MPRLTEKCRDHQVVLFCKKRFVPLTDYNQQVDISSLVALTFGYQAINKREADDDAGFAAKIQLMENSLTKVDFNLSAGDEILPMDVPYESTLGPQYDFEARHHHLRVPPV